MPAWSAKATSNASGAMTSGQPWRRRCHATPTPSAASIVHAWWPPIRTPGTTDVPGKLGKRTPHKWLLNPAAISRTYRAFSWKPYPPPTAKPRIARSLTAYSRPRPNNHAASTMSTTGASLTISSSRGTTAPVRNGPGGRSAVTPAPISATIPEAAKNPRSQARTTCRIRMVRTVTVAIIRTSTVQNWYQPSAASAPKGLPRPSSRAAANRNVTRASRRPIGPTSASGRCRARSPRARRPPATSRLVVRVTAAVSPPRRRDGWSQPSPGSARPRCAGCGQRRCRGCR